jgi:hypothetical protein
MLDLSQRAYTCHGASGMKSTPMFLNNPADPILASLYAEADGGVDLTHELAIGTSN